MVFSEQRSWTKIINAIVVFNLHMRRSIDDEQYAKPVTIKSNSYRTIKNNKLTFLQPFRNFVEYDSNFEYHHNITLSYVILS